MKRPAPRRIQSRDNVRFQRWQQLLESRGIKRNHQFLVFGKKVVREILQEQSDRCLELIYPASWRNPLPTPTTVSHYLLDGRLFQTLDVFGTRAPVLVCKTPMIYPWNPEEAPQGLELVCPLGDPSNIGALVRTSQAFGVQKMVVLKEAASPFHPKSTRSASGSVFKVSFAEGPSLKDLRDRHILTSMVALDVSGTDLSVFQWPKNVRMIIGEEGQGLPDGRFIKKVSIPMMTGMHSLNAVVAASIGMYAYRLRYPF